MILIKNDLSARMMFGNNFVDILCLNGWWEFGSFHYTLPEIMLIQSFIDLKIN